MTVKTVTRDLNELERLHLVVRPDRATVAANLEALAAYVPPAGGSAPRGALPADGAAARCRPATPRER